MTQSIFTDHVEEGRPPFVLRAFQTIVYGGLLVGVLDGLAATINAAVKGLGPDKVFHYIASGLIGPRASYNGGAATVMLGIVLHFTIAFGVVAVFLFFSRSFPVLLHRAVLSGVAYGMVVYFAMAYLIVPLSAVPKTPFSFSGMITSLVIHVFCVGLPTAFIVRSRSMSRE